MVTMILKLELVEGTALHFENYFQTKVALGAQLNDVKGTPEEISKTAFILAPGEAVTCRVQEGVAIFIRDLSKKK